MKNWNQIVLIGILTIFAIVVTACTKKGETQSQTSTAEQTQTFVTQAAVNIYPQILNGDLSAFAGKWWENESGRTRMQLATELKDRPFGDGYTIDGFGFHKEYGYYYWNQFYNDKEKQEHLVYFIYLYPPGVEVCTYEGRYSYFSDVSKVRMAYGHGIEPTAELVDVFYLQEEEYADNYSQILNGDLSEFGGVWVNINGKRAHLLSFGVFVFEGQEGDYADDYKARDFKKQEDGSYTWGVYQGEGGTWVTLYPVGIEVKDNLHNKILQTDTTKVRITRGFVGDNTDVYYMEG